MASDAVAAEALARAIVPLVKESERKRYLPGEPDSALSQADALRIVRAKFSKPSQAQVDEQHVTEGVLGISNPALYKKGLRWKDAFTSDKTAVYYVWDKPTSAQVWPQTQAHFQSYGGNTDTGDPVNTGPSVQEDIPNRNSHVQLSNFLFLTTLRRTIRENKNQNGYYTAYQWYGTDGSVDFRVAGAGNTNVSYTVCVPGGAVYSPPGTGTQYNAMMNPAPATSFFAVANSNTILRIPASAFSAVHGQFLPGMSYQGRTYIWNDGFSGTNGYTQKQVPYGSGGIFGAWVDSTSNFPTQAGDGITTPYVGQVADVQVGSLIVLNGTVQVPANQHFEINLWRYNTKQPYIVTSVSGSVGATNQFTSSVMAVFNITPQIMTRD